MEALINIANFLYIGSYFVQDLLRIRMLTVTAAAILVAYFWLQPEPLMTIVYWNLFFILLNLFQVARIVIERRTGRDPVFRLLAHIRQRLAARPSAIRR